MDYSLLLGVDRQNRQLVVGIIDFVRQVWSMLYQPLFYDLMKCFLLKVIVLARACSLTDPV